MVVKDILKEVKCSTYLCGYTQRFYRDKRSYISKIGKVVTQPVKIIRTLDPFKPKI